MSVLIVRLRVVAGLWMARGALTRPFPIHHEGTFSRGWPRFNPEFWECDEAQLVELVQP